MLVRSCAGAAVFCVWRLARRCSNCAIADCDIAGTAVTLIFGVKAELPLLAVHRRLACAAAADVLCCGSSAVQ